MGPDLNLAGPLRVGSLARPGGADGMDPMYCQRIPRTNRNGVGGWRDGQYEARLTVGRRRAKPETTALPDGEPVRTGVLANPGPSYVDDVPRSIAEPLFQEFRSVAIGDEADVMAIWLVRDSQAALSRLCAYVGLMRGTERKVGAAQLILVEHAQHVRLVLAGINGAMQLDAIGAAA
jgi:hypothetical protein